MTGRKAEKLPVQSPPAPVPVEVEPEAGPELEATDAEAFRAVLLAEPRAEYARIEEAERETREAIGVKLAEHEVEMGRWRVKAEKAREQYQLEPERPDPPDTSRERALLEHLFYQRDAVSKREEKILGWSRLQVETAWQKARQELAQEASEGLEIMNRVLSRAMAWNPLVLDSRRADDNSKGHRNGDAQRTKQQLDLLDVIDLARGIDVLKPEPPQSRIETIPHGEDAAEMRRIGKQVESIQQREAAGVRFWL